jgi:hypothetical protein
MKIMMSERRNQNALANSPTRRQVIAGAAMMFGGLALGLTKLRAATGEEISRTAESIHQETVFKASQKRVYEALTDAKQFNEVTKIIAARERAISLEKSPTVISPDVGGAFSLFRRHHPRTDTSSLCRTRESSKPGEMLTGLRVFTRLRDSSSSSKALGPKSFLTIPAFPRATLNTSRRDGRRIIGSRSRNSWLRLSVYSREPGFASPCIPL